MISRSFCVLIDNCSVRMNNNRRPILTRNYFHPLDFASLKYYYFNEWECAIHLKSDDRVKKWLLNAHTFHITFMDMHFNCRHFMFNAWVVSSNQFNEMNKRERDSCPFMTSWFHPDMILDRLILLYDLISSQSVPSRFKSWSKFVKDLNCLAYRAQRVGRILMNSQIRAQTEPEISIA